MIWLFKVDEVFWKNKPKVNDYYLFKVDDINFDITQYDLPLYFELAKYYLLSDSDEDNIYQLQFKAMNKNPNRKLIPENCEIYNIIKDFYTKNKKR